MNLFLDTGSTPVISTKQCTVRTKVGFVCAVHTSTTSVLHELTYYFKNGFAVTVWL